MDLTQRLFAVAVQDLARRLAVPPRLEPRPQAAESSPQPDFSATQPGFDQQVLQSLAREVVSAVLGLSGQEPNPDLMNQTVQNAVHKQLNEQIPGKERLIARLAAEIPHLINLPRLASLAAQGLSLAPLQACGPQSEPVLGNSPAFVQAMQNLEQVARTDFPVVLWGETGTGKELMARRLHQLSARQDGPFVPLNCAALSGNLLESELFGHVKGAFTGAEKAKPGYIRAAQGGTLFLDEIAESGGEFQMKLLRVLEERLVVPVGDTKGMPVDFRLVCASHLDLEEEAVQGRFHKALLYRINVLPLHLPPLRERSEDIAPLASHFLDQACRMAGVTRHLHPDTLKHLKKYDWPGNVRELRHLMQRLTALSGSEQITPDMLPPSLKHSRLDSLQGMLLERLNREPQIPRVRTPELAGFLAGQCGQTVSNSDLRDALGCSDSTAKNLFRVLSKLGFVKAMGQRGGRKYLISEPIGAGK